MSDMGIYRQLNLSRSEKLNFANKDESTNRGNQCWKCRYHMPTIRVLLDRVPAPRCSWAKRQFLCAHIGEVLQVEKARRKVF